MSLQILFIIILYTALNVKSSITNGCRYKMVVFYINIHNIELPFVQSTRCSIQMLITTKKYLHPSRILSIKILTVRKFQKYILICYGIGNSSVIFESAKWDPPNKFAQQIYFWTKTWSKKGDTNGKTWNKHLQACRWSAGGTL